VFTNDGNIKLENLLSLTNVYINHYEICNSHAYGGYFLRDLSIAHNINGITIRNCKYINIYIYIYIYINYVINKESSRLPINMSIGFAMPQFVLSPFCLAFPHLLANNLFFVFLYHLKYPNCQSK